MATAIHRAFNLRASTEGLRDIPPLTSRAYQGFQYWYVHTFLTSATFTVPAGCSLMDVLIVGGGGGGAAGGGGGAGGLIYATSKVLTPGEIFNVVVGTGGTGGDGASSTPGSDGANSYINPLSGTLTAIGGGGGGQFNAVGRQGGSGGGAGGRQNKAGGDADYISPRQGYDGGNSEAGNVVGQNASGGGGGASSVGLQGIWTVKGGDGGAGFLCNISGSPVYYAGGGGGSGYLVIGGTGTHGGGNGGSDMLGGINATAGTDGLGGGGGGSQSGVVGKKGGSGIVIIRYLL